MYEYQIRLINITLDGSVHIALQDNERETIRAGKVIAPIILNHPDQVPSPDPSTYSITLEQASHSSKEDLLVSKLRGSTVVLREGNVIYMSYHNSCNACKSAHCIFLVL